MSVEEQLKIDPNTADAAALRKLPGVGPAIARRIIAARPFAGPQDLSRVPGLGKGAPEIRPHPVKSRAQSDLTKATGELQALSGSLQAIGRRLEALEGLTGRMVAVEEQGGALKGDVGEALG